MPRRYDMTTRAAAAAATRLKILRAAGDVYATEGFRAASMQAVARAADVSPVTVLNHFGTSEALLEAALELISSELGLPDPAELAALPTVEERIPRFVHDIIRVYQANGRWNEVYMRDRDVPAVKRAATAFFQHVEALVRAALGPGLRDKRRVTVVMTLVAPPNVFGLQASGMKVTEVGDTIADVIVSWLGPARRSKR